MIKIPYEELIARIKDQTGLAEGEVAMRIQAKLSQLSGLISKEGAAHIIANELGIKLMENSGKIKSMYPGMRNVSILGRVQAVYPAKSFQRQDGSAGSVGSFQMADETGSLRVVCWNDQTKVIETLSSGIIVRVQNVFVRENKGFPEAHLSEQSKVLLSPPGEHVAEVSVRVQSPSAQRKAIKEIQDSDAHVELLGTLVQVFNPTFYETCPQCAKRIKANAEGMYVCESHGQVLPDYAYVLNVYLDDGSDTIRCVFFREQAESLLQKKKEDMLQFRTQPEQFESVKTDLLGTIVKMVGRPKMNTYMNRLEFNVQSVVVNPDPQEELNRINATVFPSSQTHSGNTQ